MRKICHNFRTTSTKRRSKILRYIQNTLGQVVQKLINSNPGLNVVEEFCFSRLKPFPVLILRDNLKKAKSNFKAKIICRNPGH